MSTESPIAPIDICNLALDYIGADPISSIEAPTTPLEATFARWYDFIRKLCLREYMWNCAKAYREVARSGDGVDDWQDAYLMPIDCVRINSLGDPPPNDILPDRYEIMGRTIYANNGDTLRIRYNKDLTDVTMMDMGFINYFALRLARKLAFKATKKKNLGEDLDRQLAIEEPKCISVDGQEKPAMRVQRSKYLSARRRAGVNGWSGVNNQYIDWD